MGITLQTPITYCHTVLNIVTRTKSFKMSTTANMLMLLMLTSLVTYSTCLSCWHTGSTGTGDAMYTSIRATHVPVVPKNCTSPDNVSCMKEWYTVGKVSDIFYRLGCSKMTATDAEKETEMGTGEKTVYTCKTDYCNNSNMMHPVMWLLGITIFVIMKQ